MSTRLEKLNEIQLRGLDKFEQSGFRGTAMLCPGTGKTFLAFKAAYRLKALGLHAGDRPKVYFLAETNARKITVFEDEAPKFKALFGLDFLADFELIFACYQGHPVRKYNNFKDGLLLVLDEIHETLTDNYYNNLVESKCPFVLGLTGAMSMENSVFPSRLPEGFKDRVFQSRYLTDSKQVSDECTKGQLLEMFCPVFIQYPTAQAIEDGVIAPYQTFIINHQLDSNRLYGALPGWKTSHQSSVALKVSEKRYYDTLRSISLDPMAKHFVRTRAIRLMTDCLYKAPSKVELVKAILKRLEGKKTIVFGDRLEILNLVTPNTADSKNVTKLVAKFNAGEINVIASAKMLQQGITLEGVENVVFLSYNSKWSNFEQKRARIRFLDGKQATLFFIVTKDTYEEKWIQELRVERDQRGKVIQEHDLNITTEVESTKIMEWYAKLNTGISSR